MTVGLDEATEAAADDEWQEPGRPAGWWIRAGAFGIDVLCPLAVAVTAMLIGWSAPRGGWLWWLCLGLAAVVVLAVAVNRWLLPATTGWTLGRAVFGIAVEDRDGGETPGPGRFALRDLAHVADTVPLGLGWLWPLLDSRGRTFADILVRTEVREVGGQEPDRRKRATAAIGAAGALSVLLAGLGYVTVYHHQQSVAGARAQIADEGPKIVSDLLSYTAKTATDDFAKAQTLVTDDYRPQLVQEQEAVKKAGLVDNDYWVSNSAVLSNSQDRASMLLMLQGQRGAPPKQRFVTASLRVDYEKVGDAWKVADLTVLRAPKPPPAPAPAPPESTTPKSEQPKPAPPKPEQPTPAPAKPSAGGR